MSKVVLAISGSLRKPSFTEKMLDLCIAGMGDGTEVHKFYPHRMQIGPCTGCFSCWGKKRPGECVQKDDFGKILDVYKRADYLLLAAPLYYFDLPATVKNVIDRFFVALEPSQIESPTGQTEHPKRFGRHPRAVLIASCGFPEIESFDVLSKHFKIICEHMDWPWAGEILVSAAGAANAPKLFDTKYELVKRAGAELIDGEVSSEVMAAIAAPVMSAADYRQLTTLSFRGGIIARVKLVAITMKALRSPRKPT